jgi:hypothetical protein
MTATHSTAYCLWMLRIKRAHTEDLKEEVYALRYRAYLQEGAIEPHPSERFCDHFDNQPNNVTWALTDHGRVVGSIRTTWYDPADPTHKIPEQLGYPEEVERLATASQRILSGNRFVTEPDRPQRDSLYPILLLRHHMMVAHQRADLALAAVRSNHLPFYRRMLQLERVSEGRIYPGLKSVMYLTACNFSNGVDSVYVNTPSLKPKGYERMFLDLNYKDIWEVGIPAEI